MDGVRTDRDYDEDANARNIIKFGGNTNARYLFMNMEIYISINRESYFLMDR